MQNTILVTIIAIVVSTLLIAYIRRVTKDRCLKSFKNDTVTLLMSDQIEITGKLIVESTGIEVIYDICKVEKLPPEEGDSPELYHASHILFKQEYGTLTAIIRRHDQLDEKAKLEREKEIKYAYHPGPVRRTVRKIRNFFMTIKDSLLEIINILSGQFETANPGSVLTTHKAQKSKVEKELVGTITNSYDALLEKYIGRLVLCEFNMNGTKTKITGILKDYTAGYLEILDTSIKTSQDETYKSADVILPRALAIVRHLGESAGKLSFFDMNKYKKYINILKK